MHVWYEVMKTVTISMIHSISWLTCALCETIAYLLLPLTTRLYIKIRIKAVARHTDSRDVYRRFSECQTSSENENCRRYRL